MSQILNNLYLGDYADAKDMKLLKNLHITHILVNFYIYSYYYFKYRCL